VSVVIVATAFPIPEHKADVIAASRQLSHACTATRLRGQLSAQLRADLAGKLSGDLDVQVLVPHLAGTSKGAL
jgi:hypothetical protein